jgi:hypothetical protein
MGMKHGLLVLKEERRLWQVENTEVGRIFGLKMDESEGGWRKLNNERLLLAKYCYNDEIKKDEMGKACRKCG